MGCLFGYCGRPADGLLDRMAGVLKHRCKNGAEKIRQTLSEGYICEVGHGIAPWVKETHVAAISDRHMVFGYSGVFFNIFPEKDEYRTRAEGILDRTGDSPEERLPKLEGAFVAALAEGHDLFLVRDPSGIKTLYWTQHRERLVFASEIKALFADPSVSPRIRIGALPEYLTFSFVPGERTMMEGVYELQPGSLLTYKNDRVSIRRYFEFENMEEDSADRKSDREYGLRLRSELEKSVNDCCSSNNGNPPAVFLSGGIDSSAVLAITAKRFPDAPIKTFSVHFGPKYANENEFVAMMVDRYRTDHTWLEIRPKTFIKRLREIIWCLDDPIGDPITVPNFLLAQAASEVSEMVLNGEGGDPCFGGPKNIPMILSRLYGPLPGQPAKAWMERNYLLSYRKCFSDLEKLLNPDVLKESGGEEALMDIISPFLSSHTPRSFLNKLMTINIRLKGANLILVKVDKMSSANGLLALAPLFSQRVIASSMRCPPDLKLAGNIEKNVLKRAVEDILPMPIVLRPKSGMMVPVRFWFQGEMKRFARKLLSRKNVKRLGFFNPVYVKNLLDYNKNEIQSAHHGLKLWMMITFMFWYEQMIEDHPMPAVSDNLM